MYKVGVVMVVYIITEHPARHLWLDDQDLLGDRPLLHAQQPGLLPAQHLPLPLYTMGRQAAARQEEEVSGGGGGGSGDRVGNSLLSLLSLFIKRAPSGNRSRPSVLKEQLEQNERIAIFTFSNTYTRAIGSL